MIENIKMLEKFLEKLTEEELGEREMKAKKLLSSIKEVRNRKSNAQYAALIDKYGKEYRNLAKKATKGFVIDFVLSVPICFTVSLFPSLYSEDGKVENIFRDSFERLAGVQSYYNVRLAKNSGFKPLQKKILEDMVMLMENDLECPEDVLKLIPAEHFKEANVFYREVKDFTKRIEKDGYSMEDLEYLHSKRSI